MKNSRVEWRFDPADKLGVMQFCGEIDLRDVMDLRLDGLDRMVINSPIKTAADLFQTLQIIFFRAQQQAAISPAVGIPTGTMLE